MATQNYKFIKTTKNIKGCSKLCVRTLVSATFFVTAIDGVSHATSQGLAAKGCANDKVNLKLVVQIKHLKNPENLAVMK